MRALTALLAAAGVALTLGLGAPALAEQGTVILSTSDAYPVGTSLADGATLLLSEGTSISVLTISSRVVEVNGAFDGTLPGGSTASASLADNLAAAVFQTDEGSPEIGGVRGIGDLTPNMIMPGTVVDTTVGGDTCLLEGSDFGLYRKASTVGLGDWTVGDLTSVQSGEAVRVHWYSLEYSIAWPEELQYSDGSEFSIFMANTPTPVSFKIHVLPESDSAAELINWMAERGCVTQIQILAASLETT